MPRTLILPNRKYAPVNFILQFLKVATLTALLTVPLSAEDVGQPIQLDTSAPLSDVGVDDDKKHIVPEPGVFALIGTAGILLMLRRRSR